MAVPDGSQKIQKQVQEFYDQVGWQEEEDGQFTDARKFEDLRPVSREYLHRCHLRVKRYLPQQGRYLLDAASGPIQYPEYLEYSREHQFRVCVDISRLALLQARKRIGERGLFVQSDVSALPFQDNSMDGMVSLHTIYHVSRDRQERAIREVYRVLKPGSSAVIVYTWGDKSLLMRVFVSSLYFVRYLPGRILRFVLRRPLPKPQLSSGPTLYGYMHDYDWFLSRNWGFPMEIKPWRGVNLDFLRLYVHRWLLGRYLLRFIFFLEELFPDFFGKYGAYPAIIIKKEDS